MKTNRFFNLISFIFYPALLLAMISSPTVSGRVLDNFNDNTKTGWKDFTFGPGLGTITETGGQFKISVPAVGQALFAASTKTSDIFTIKDGRTIEFRIDMISGNSKDSFAVLSWIPTTESPASLAGYSLAKSSTDVLIVKGLNKYFYDENPEPPVKNENVTLVLSLYGAGASVVINAKVLDKDNNNAVLFEQTFVDTPEADVLADGTDDPPAPFTGDGYFVLMGYADYEAGGPPAYEVVFDNASVMVLDYTVLDNFNDNVKTDWKDFTFGPGLGTITETGGQFKFQIPAVGQPIFAGSTKTSRKFDVVDGERIELIVDIVTANSEDSFAVLSWIPVTESIASLSGYSLAKSPTDILVVKGLNKYFYNEDPEPPVKNDNVTLVLSLTGVGNSVVINAKVLDRDNFNAVIFDQTFVDTPEADVLADGTDDPPAPYMGSGNFVLIGYADYDPSGPPVYEIIFDHAAVVAPPIVGNTPPNIADIQPENFANFLPATTPVTFKVNDDKAIPHAGISLTLNSARITSTNGLVITGTTTNVNVQFSGLEADVNYVATIRAVDADGATNSATIYFDTFSSQTIVVEAEDYNFSAGQFIDNPVILSELSGPQPDTYRWQMGLPDIDYYDTRTSYDIDFTYRPWDFVGQKRSLDIVRQKFIDAGGAEIYVFDYDVGEIRAGEYLNYTRTFPAGSYEVYLRESLFNIAKAEAVLEKVTSNPADFNQTTEVLGSFLGFTSGTQFRNVPLTDGLGKNKIVVQLAGVQTVRLRQVTPDPADGMIYQNYLVLVPVPAPGTQRAAVSGVFPAPGVVIETLAPYIRVTIKNRETSVKAGSITLEFNGNPVTPTITTDVNGAVVNYNVTPLPQPNSVNTVRLVFADSEDVSQTNEWSFKLTYKQFNAANRRAGTGKDPGFNVRVVQAPEGSGLDNSLLRAENQLAPNSTIPAFYTLQTNAAIINFSQNAPPSSDGYFPDDIQVPGLQPEVNGTDDFALEIGAYLQLPVGIHRFGVRSDDGYKITAGTSLTDSQSGPLAYHNGGPADETFEFLVTQAGLYPVRLVWYERGGAAYVELFSVDTTTSDKILINDLNNAKSIKAYRGVTAPPIKLESASIVIGPYQVDNSAVFDYDARKITVPLADVPAKFYRLSGEQKRKITSARIEGGNLILEYQIAQ